MSYWQNVAGRAWKETRKAVKIESKEAVVILLVGQGLLAFVLWETTGDASLTTRIATAALPFLLVIPLFAWKMISTPPVLAREMREAHTANIEAVMAENEKLKNQHRDPNEKNIEFLFKTVEALVSREIPEFKDRHALPNNLRDLRSETAKSIRSRVAAVTSSMRTMENAFMISRNRTIFNKSDDWDTHTAQIIAQSQEQTRQWRSELMPEAVALWNEMRRRIYGAPPYPKDFKAETALEHGMLAGPSPLNEAAIALERLARDMPG